MGREIRRVPANWDHPRNEHGNFQSMRDTTFAQACAEWDADKAAWDRGERSSYGKDATYTYEDLEGARPDDPAGYRPWATEDATWFQVWETVSEGSPTTPPFATEDELIDHLATEGESLMPQRWREGPWSRANAEQFVKDTKRAPSMIIAGGRIYTAKDGMPPKDH